MASVPAQIAEVLRRGGLNRVGVAGVLGNAYAESSYRPSATGYGGGGLWGFTAAPNSLADLQAYAKKRGRSWTDAGLQTEFLLQHVSPSLKRELNAASSPEAAARVFMSQWERPGIPRQSVRESAARKAFQMPFQRVGPEPHRETHEGEEPSSVSGDLMHAGLVGLLVLGGAGMVGLGATRLMGSAGRGRRAA